MLIEVGKRYIEYGIINPSAYELKFKLKALSKLLNAKTKSGPMVKKQSALCKLLWIDV